MNAERIYHFDDFTLSSSEYSLYKKDEKIRLRPKVFAALLYLIQHKGRLVKKSELLENLWPEVIVTENTLNKCIDEARRALNDNAYSPRFIETVPRMGFKFIADVAELSPDQATQMKEIEPDKDNPKAGNAHIKEDIPDNTIKKQLWIKPILFFCLALFFVWIVYEIFISDPADVESLYGERIAVLPFLNFSSDSDDIYFADGMTEEMISALSQIHGIKVIARASVMQYKESRNNLSEIGKELDVRHILDGSVRKIENNLRITVQLIDTDNQVTVWSRDYNRKLENVFEIQTDIAQSVANVLEIRLKSQEKRSIFKQPTENLDAYIFYLKGRHEWNKRTEKGLKQSFEYFGQAINLDPNFARAYSGLADAYSYFAIYHIIPAREAFPLARQAAIAALTFDNNLAEAHISMAAVLEGYYWDWPEAEKEYKKATSLNPNYAEAHKEYAEFLMFMGHSDKALQQAQQALLLDPLSIITNGTLGHILYRSQKYDQAIEQLENTLEKAPGELLNVPLWHLAMAYIQKGMADMAIVKLHTWLPDSANNPDLETVLGYAYAVSGKKKEAIEIRDSLKKQYLKPKKFYHFDLNMDMAIISTGLGNYDKTFYWLEKAYSNRAPSLVLIKTEPVFKPLHSDPRYKAFLKKLKMD